MIVYSHALCQSFVWCCAILCSANDAGGTKVSLDYLWRRLREKEVDVDQVWDSITDTITKSLVCVDDVVPHQPNAFEVYGYDLLIDEDLKTWLIEVNASPSMGCDSSMDTEIKVNMIKDTLNVVREGIRGRTRRVLVLRWSRGGARPGVGGFDPVLMV